MNPLFFKIMLVGQFHYVIIRPQPWNLWDELFAINSEFYPTGGINMQKNLLEHTIFITTINEMQHHKQ